MASRILNERRSLNIGLFEKIEAAIQAGDMEAVASYYNKDFKIKMHSNDAVMTKRKVGEKGSFYLEE